MDNLRHKFCIFIILCFLCGSLGVLVSIGRKGNSFKVISVLQHSQSPSDSVIFVDDSDPDHNC